LAIEKRKTPATAIARVFRSSKKGLKTQDLFKLTQNLVEVNAVFAVLARALPFRQAKLEKGLELCLQTNSLLR
jgi:hypothetical protein